jgi:presequence protease
MAQSGGCPPARLKQGILTRGFRVLRVEPIEDLRMTAYEMEHERTGAKLLHLHCDDPENLFSIGFRTPPSDSTGVPHILEHAVLAGSEKYPVKDAFNDLSRASLQTFINAFTYPDKTVYPVSSQVAADYFNLARVYTDLVLNPRLLKETFYQEGHHLEFENEDIKGNLTISGIVYNEMKGAYSSPDALMFKVLQENLYRDTPYVFDAGGDPEVIPSLTYDHLKEFHRLYYSPANARFFLYGNIPPEDHLTFLEEMLQGFGKIRVDSCIPLQKKWDEPAVIRGRFPLDKDQDPRKKGVVNLAWLLAENNDFETVLLLQIVTHALVETAAGPLRRALIDSRLGEDLSPATGLELELRQVSLAVGLRGVDTDCAQAVETLILDTLEKVARTGLDRDLIEGALHQVEFTGREIVRGSYPFAILLLSRIYRTWLYDGDPLVGLRFSEHVEGIRRRWASDPELFQTVMRRWLLENPHRILAIMEPDHAYPEKQEASFRENLTHLKESLSEEELETIKYEASALKTAQAESDSPEALDKLPRLRLADIPKEVENIPVAENVLHGIPVLAHDIFANGVAYLDLAFDVSHVPGELQTCLPLLGKLSVGMGAAGLTYDEMAKRIAMKTGGVTYALASGITAAGKGNWQKMIYRVKVLHRHVPDALRILFDILVAGDLSDEGRIRDLVYEKKNRIQASVVPSGHLFAQRTAAASISLPAYRDEQWHGRTHLKFLDSIAGQFQDQKTALQENLTRLKEMVFRQDGMVINITGDSEGLERLLDGLAPLVSRLPAGGNSHAIPTSGFDLEPVHTGIHIPAQVCYVARVLPAPSYLDPESAALMVLSKELSKGYLYNRIRVQGGAYGGMSVYDPVTGLFSFLSYRDPHLVETLKVYDEAARFVLDNPVDKKELEKGIMGTIGALDRPMDPAGKGYISMIRSFIGIADADRQEFRNRILSMTSEALTRTAMDFFIPSWSTSAVCVYASPERLAEANEILDPKLMIEALV